MPYTRYSTAMTPELGAAVVEGSRLQTLEARRFRLAQLKLQSRRVAAQEMNARTNRHQMELRREMHQDQMTLQQEQLEQQINQLALRRQEEKRRVQRLGLDVRSQQFQEAEANLERLNEQRSFNARLLNAGARPATEGSEPTAAENVVMDPRGRAYYVRPDRWAQTNAAFERSYAAKIGSQAAKSDPRANRIELETEQIERRLKRAEHRFGALQRQTDAAKEDAAEARAEIEAWEARNPEAPATDPELQELRARKKAADFRVDTLQKERHDVREELNTAEDQLRQVRTMPPTEAPQTRDSAELNEQGARNLHRHPGVPSPEAVRKLRTPEAIAQQLGAQALSLPMPKGLDEQTGTRAVAAVLAQYDPQQPGHRALLQALLGQSGTLEMSETRIRQLMEIAAPELRTAVAPPDEPLPGIRAAAARRRQSAEPAAARRRQSAEPAAARRRQPQFAPSRVLLPQTTLTGRRPRLF